MNPFLRNCLALLIVGNSAAHGQLAGQAALSDYRLEPAGPHQVTVGYGTSSSLDLTLANQSASPADWRLAFENTGTAGLAGVLEGLDKNAAQLLSVIPDRYLFSDGITGSSISDGGGDMYDGGNMLQAGTTGLPYSNGILTNTAAGTGSVSYFTRKLDGLFVFAADFTGVDTFAITGNLGADGAGVVAADEFVVNRDGVSYQAYVHRVHSSGDPSINQLILVPQKTGLSRTYLPTTADENHRVAGLGASSRVYYLLFAKAAGGFYSTDVFQNLATAFLSSVKTGPAWAFGNPAQGSVDALQSGPVKIGVSAVGVAPGNYSARFAVVPQGLAYAAIPSGAFRDLNLTVSAPSFTVPTGPVAASTLSGLSPAPMDVTLQPSVAGTVLSGLQASSSQSWLIPTVVAGTNTIRLTFNGSSLAPGTYRATVDVWNGATRQTFEVSLVTSALNVVKFLPDPARPRIYAINGNGQEQGSLLVIDALTHVTLRNIPLGRKPTDCDIGDGGATLFAINSVDQTITVVDLATLAVTKTHTLPAYTNWGAVETHAHVRAGKGNILYYVDGQWGPRLRVFNRVTGQVLQTFGASTTGTSNDDGIGGLVLAPNGAAIYTWEQYGWSAGSSGTYISKFRVNADGTLAFESKTTWESSGNFDRDPLDTPAMITSDGSRLVVKGRAFLTSNLGEAPAVYPDEIYSITRGAEVAAGASAIYSGAGGEILHTLPVAAPVQAITPDYSTMVYFNPTSRAVVWLDLVATVGTKALGLQIEPIDGATVISPTRLKWFPVTGILRYQVYLGTNRSAVEAATPTSPGYLGETGNTWFDLATPLAVGQSYFWRVVPIAADGQPAGTGVTRSFLVSNLTLSRSSIEAATVEGVMRHEESITLQAASPQPWSATADVPWISFGATSGTTPGELVVRFDATSLAPGLRSGNITLTSGGVSFAIPVALRIYAANFMLAEADLELPWVYVVSQESNTSTQPSFLLRINTATNRIESAVACGRSVTDLAVHYPENRLYLTNWQTGVLRAFDRGTFKQVQTYQFPPLGSTGYGDGGLWRVAAGKMGRLILEEADQWIDIRLINTANGAVIASNSSEYAGDGEADPSGRYYYHAEGISSSDSMRRFDLAADTFGDTTPTATAQGTSVVMIGDGSKVTAGSRVFDSQLGFQFALPADVRAGTLHGDLLFTSTKAYNGTNGLEMATLPSTADLMSVTGDQKKLYLFAANSKTFGVVDLSVIAALPPREITPTIADGSTVIGINQSLAWSIEPFANSYRVYFGTSRDAIESATESSAGYLGSSPGNSWTGALPALALDGNYFWRVDTVGFAGTRKGVVWSFNVAPVDVAPSALELAFPVSSPIPRQRVALSSPSSQAWTASSTTPWIRLRSNSGTTPGLLEFDLDTSGLTTGLKVGSITLQAGADTFSVPVRLQLLALNITKLVAHPTRPVVYGINSAGTGGGFSHLLEIDAATANILRSLPIGFSPTDADLDATNERLYISNWGYSQTRVVNVADWLELPFLSLGNDVYKLEVTSRGRILTEGYDQWISLGMWNASTGASLTANLSVREGDGETDPTGAFYYHCDNNISNAHITKYNVAGDAFTNVAEGPQFGGYGSRNLILSRDGSRLFWVGRVLNADLAVIAQMPGEIHATNRTGALAVGAGAIWWSDSGTVVGTLPFESTVTTISADDSHLVRFNPITRTLHSTPLSTFTDLPGPLPRPGEVLDASPSRLSWSAIAGATAYRVFIAADAATLAAMTSPVATVSTTYYDLPSPLAFGTFYSWRVDAVTASGVTAGVARSFAIRFPQGPAMASISSGSGGISASISDRHLLVGVEGSAQLYQYDPATGISSPTQSFTLPGYYWDHQFGSAVAMDAGKASVGAYALDNPADGGGSAFVYRAGNFGYWESSGPLSPPAPVAGESFGRSLAASGNQMLVGTSYSYNRVGRVAAYVTEPAATRLQVFGASDGQTGDSFGQVIAMEGNDALISAPGPGSSYSRLPVIYAFSRSTKTGLWTQTQKIAIPGATASDNSGTALALSGNYFATNRGSSTAVLIYAKNTSGQWIQSATISQAGVVGSAGNSFGGALALTGERLFIGDTAATSAGFGGGGVFSFRRSGTAWIPGPVIIPTGTRSNFGRALAVRDGWLLATGSSPQPAWLFRIDAAANHTPTFEPDIPTQVVAGRAFSTQIRASDADGNAGLIVDLLQGPTWLGLTDQSGGRATLSGTPAGKSGDVHLVQIRVRDAAGSQALHTYQLTLLSPADLPVLTLQPIGVNAGEGQEVSLRAAVSGIGPFKWQWYLDGKAIPGANRASLAFGEILLSNSGDYSVHVTNVVGEAISSTARINVHPADRFAGNWPTFGGSARHTGYHPARLGRHTFVPAWSRQIHATNALNRVAVADGRVFVSASSRFEAAPTIRALDLAGGGDLWTASIPSSNSINPPTWHDGTVYFQRGKGVSEEIGPQLIALNAATGARRWASVFGAQWESYEAPAVTDDGIWINGGYYGGMYGFSLLGTEKFYLGLPQVDGWTPTVSGGRLFSCVGGGFQEHNPADGATLWSVIVTTTSYAGTGVSAVAGDSAVVISGSDVVCIDLASRAIRWKRPGSFSGDPAISNGRAYVIQDAKVLSFSLADGTAGPVVTVPAAILSGQPLLVMGHMFLASSANTYVVDLATSAVVRTLAGGGLLSYSQGYLLAAGTDGTLRAWYANGAPEFTADLPVAINAGDAAADLRLDLSNYLSQPDPGDTLTWSLVSVSDRSFFRSLQIGASSGVLSVVYNPWLQGSSSAVIAVTDSLGQRTEVILTFTLPVLPVPLVTVDPVIRFSRLTGLYEQTVTVTNLALREIAGFDLSVSGLRAGVSLYNGSSTGVGSGQINHHQPMPAGASVTMILEYYASPRGAIPPPLITAGVAGPEASMALLASPGEGPAFAVNRILKQADGGVVIEFNAEPGKSYQIQYSDDAVYWKTCPVSIKAGGTNVQWIDRGPPWTETAPSSKPSRFYRVQRL